MKWYLASRTRHSAKLRELAEILKQNNCQISSQWIYIDEALKPFVENIERVQEISIQNINAFLDTDVFMLVNDLQGVDIFIEMGAALARKESGKDMRIYVVGDYNKTSFTQLHPSIIHTKSVQEVFDLEKINYGNFKFPTFE